MPTIDGTKTNETPEQRNARLGLTGVGRIDEEFASRDPVTYQHDEDAGKIVAKPRMKKSG